MKGKPIVLKLKPETNNSIDLILNSKMLGGVVKGDVFEKMMTSVEILVDDTVYHACGIGGATAIMEGKNVKDVKVVDFKTFKLVDA